jgi:ubiquinone/menaquinone biosynthesis C-methylase UbiE
MTPKNTSWGDVAKWYDDLIEGSADSYQKKVLAPNLLRIIEPKKGMTILDIACGQGYFSRAFAESGAKVFGCDISKELIAIAKTGNVGAENAKVEFKVNASDDLQFMADGAADVAIIILSLQNIENIAGTLAEAHRSLKAGGRLVIVLNHPAFRIPKRSSWEWTEELPVEYRRIDAYMSDDQIEVDMSPGENDRNKKAFTISFHRPLQSYFKALSKAGFAVTRLEEWISHKKSQPGPRAAEEDRMRKEIPMFLCLEARK